MVSLETKKWYAFSEYKVEKYGSASSENCWDTSELDNSVSCKSEIQSLFIGRRTKEDCIKTWEDYWLKRGLSLASLSLWKLSDYSWDPKHMPEELKELCEGELLVAGADEAWYVCPGPEDLKKLCGSFAVGCNRGSCPILPFVLLFSLAPGVACYFSGCWVTYCLLAALVVRLNLCCKRKFRLFND